MRVLNEMSTDDVIAHYEHYKSIGFDFLITDFYWKVDDKDKLLSYAANQKEDMISANIKITDSDNPIDYNSYIMNRPKPYAPDIVYNGSVKDIWLLSKSPLYDIIPLFNDSTQVAKQRKRVARKKGKTDLLVEYFANRCQNQEEMAFILPYAIHSQTMSLNGKHLNYRAKKIIKDKTGTLYADFQNISVDGLPSYGSIPFHFLAKSELFRNILKEVTK